MTATATRGETAAKAAPPAKKSFPKSKAMIFLIVGLLIAGGAAYFLVLKPKPKPGPPVGGDIVALDSETVNLAGGHYLKVGVAVQLIQGAASATDFENSKADALVISEFADRSVTSLSSNTARQQLSNELLAKLKVAYPDEIFAIFLTQFVTQ